MPLHRFRRHADIFAVCHYHCHAIDMRHCIAFFLSFFIRWPLLLLLMLCYCIRRAAIAIFRHCRHADDERHTAAMPLLSATFSIMPPLRCRLLMPHAAAYFAITLCRRRLLR